MSKSVKVTLTDTHYKWLDSVREKKGLDSPQDVVRDIVTKAYEQSKKGEKNE